METYNMSKKTFRSWVSHMSRIYAFQRWLYTCCSGGIVRPYSSPFEKETVEKAALRAIKHLFPSTVLALLSETLYCVQPRTRDFELNLKSGGSILWWLGVKRVASIAFEAVIPRERRGNFRLNPKPSIGMDRYRFTGLLVSWQVYRREMRLFKRFNFVFHSLRDA